jgi:hypothetical protein
MNYSDCYLLSAYIIFYKSLVVVCRQALALKIIYYIRILIQDLNEIT